MGPKPVKLIPLVKPPSHARIQQPLPPLRPHSPHAQQPVPTPTPRGPSKAEQEVAAMTLQAAARGKSARDLAKKERETYVFSQYKRKPGQGPPRAVSKMSVTQKEADTNGDGVIDLNEALDFMRRQSLRHEKMVKIRAGAAPPSDAAQSDTAAFDEPAVSTRADVQEWRRWAVESAKRHADTCHPRMQRKDGPPQRLPLTAKKQRLLESLGIVPCLYLDLLKLCAGYCLLGGLMTGTLSCWSSASHAHEVYTPATLSGYPTLFSRLSIGARTACTTPSCSSVNLATAILEVVFAALLLLGTAAFRRRARRLAMLSDAHNVFTREYAVQLHGLPQNVTAEEVKDHLEAVLPRFAGVGSIVNGGSRGPHSVWDVALIMNCSDVLGQAVKQAPLERRWTILSTRLERLRAFKAERDTGWALNQRIGELRDEVEATSQALLRVRERCAVRGFPRATEVCGAFVTFNEQEAARACLRLYGGSTLHYVLQKPELRFHGRRLRAFVATEPRDVLHENLPHRILSCGPRGLETALRRCVSFVVLSTFLLASFGTIIAITSSKTDLQRMLLEGQRSTLPPALVAAVEQGFPTLASFVVVGVNTALATLVSVLGRFERHPTLSATHRSKAITIFLSQAFNTGIVPLVVSMSPPPKAIAADLSYCNCTGYFCCVAGPKGVIARGLHATMDASWHTDVGSLLVASLLLQAVVEIFSFVAPCAFFLTCRRLRRGSVLHRYDMEALYEWPEKDLPKAIGKAYAFFLVMLMYAALEPILYLIGLVFFVGLWMIERYAMLRLHRTPPPYSYHLIYSTLGWLPWAVLLHVSFAFWGYASLPSQPLGVNATWVPPFGNTSMNALLLGVASSSASLLSIGSSNSSATGLDASALSSLVVINDALSYVYDLPGHINSVPTLVLFVAACTLLVPLLLLRLRASPLYFPLAPLEAALVASARACGRVVCQRAHGKVVPQPATELMKEVVDPPFDQVLRGVERTNIRTAVDGKVVTEAQLALGRMGCCARVMSFSITPLIFRLLGLYEPIAPVSEEEWTKATPVFTRLTRAADISYQPEYHPAYERAFVYLAEPERLQAYATRPARAASSVEEDEWEREEDDDESSAQGAGDQAQLDGEESEDSDLPFSDDPDKVPLCAIL